MRGRTIDRVRRLARRGRGFDVAVAVACGVAGAGAASTGCNDVGSVVVDGVAVDVDGYLAGRRAGLGGGDAMIQAAVGAGSVTVGELPDVAPAPIASDGRFEVGEVPGGRRLHLVASSPTHCTSYDGLGLQFPEDDVHGYPLGLLPRAGFAAAVAARAGTPVDAARMIVFVLLDAGRFPDSEILDDQITARLSGGGRVLWGGWDPDAAAYVVADGPDEFTAPAAFAGLVAVIDGEEGSTIRFQDHAAPAGLRPATFLVYTIRPQVAQCVFYFLRALG